MDAMDKRFDPKSYEQEWQRRWREGGVFRVEPDPERPSFCVMIPPPNVTGKLHMGHALQSALQDLLTRWHRMRGANALWLPGTDHAGIATQMMVEKDLARQGVHRRDLGREAFLERMWAWKALYQGNIREQLDLLGASCDWTREAFTLDERLSVAVREAFVRLYREGLITRGEYMVNWSPVLATAVSDLEVEMKPVAGKLYHLAYPVEGSDEVVVVATTRPETMLGDTGIAVHPDDERYRHLLGRFAILPLVGRRIPFVADSAVDPAFGTGLVKVTPFHDPADFEMGRRHGLPAIQVIGWDGRMTAEAGEAFAGLDRAEARLKVVEALRALGALGEIKDHPHNVGHSERTGEPIEPMISLQWFCDVSGMARQALEAERDGRLTLVPESWSKTWEHWLESIRPWCLSRQLWWGHRIPAWYDEAGNVFVGHSLEDVARQAGTDRLRQDEDVLDTWFSSALWPFSTLGWPEETPDLKAFYPTTVLVTGFDILFFWVARMVMAGLHLTGEVPFATVHLTQLVRDAEGQKMSKTRGNGIDPVDLIDEYGADALRFFLVSQDTPGRDILVNADQLAGYRAFGNKIWNATRFALSRVGEARVPVALDASQLAAPERWILSRLARTATEVHERFTTYRFDEACSRLYHFFWGELCDWYLELTKPALAGEAPRPQVGEVVLAALDRSLRLLHPIMPFLTEELWQRLPGHEAIHPETIVLAPYPLAEAGWLDDEIEARMGLVLDLVGRVRALRTGIGLVPKEQPTLFLHAEEAATAVFLGEQAPLISFLCRLAAVELGPLPAEASRDRLPGLVFGLTLPGRDLAGEERKRLEGELEKVADEVARINARLANEQFIARAPAELVAATRAKRDEAARRQAELEAGLAALGG
jgi:valyl-tRNA synthetase